jgi:hypothetical protein
MFEKFRAGRSSIQGRAKTIGRGCFYYDVTLECFNNESLVRLDVG